MHMHTCTCLLLRWDCFYLIMLYYIYFIRSSAVIILTSITNTRRPSPNVFPEYLSYWLHVTKQLSFGQWCVTPGFCHDNHTIYCLASPWLISINNILCERCMYVTSGLYRSCIVARRGLCCVYVPCVCVCVCVCVCWRWYITDSEHNILRPQDITFVGVLWR